MGFDHRLIRFIIYFVFFLTIFTPFLAYHQYNEEIGLIGILRNYIENEGKLLEYQKHSQPTDPYRYLTPIVDIKPKDKQKDQVKTIKYAYSNQNVVKFSKQTKTSRLKFNHTNHQIDKHFKK